METRVSDRKAEVTVRFSEFEFPPMQDVVLVGKKAPIGPEAARHMVDALSPEQYVVVSVTHESIEAIVIRKSLLNMIPKEKLLPFLLDEAGRFASITSIVKAQVRVVIEVSKAVEL